MSKARLRLLLIVTLAVFQMLMCIPSSLLPSRLSFLHRRVYNRLFTWNFVPAKPLFTFYHPRSFDIWCLEIWGARAGRRSKLYSGRVQCGLPAVMLGNGPVDSAIRKVGLTGRRPLKKNLGEYYCQSYPKSERVWAVAETVTFRPLRSKPRRSRWVHWEVDCTTGKLRQHPDQFKMNDHGRPRMSLSI